MGLLEKINDLLEMGWNAPEVIGDIPHGDMPGDKVEIGQDHIRKATLIFTELLKEMKIIANAGHNMIVVTVCGGSGVGKSETASLLSYYFNMAGIGSYTLSGDNYPRRIPVYNDAERLKTFREHALWKMLEDNVYTKERFEVIHKLQEEGMDADKANVEKYPWMRSYLEGGINGLKGYLGTDKEQNFEQLENILKQFKAGKDKIFLKRMGRTDTELWFDEVDFSNIEVLIIEWTHGNSDYFEGVDIPVLLNSTPEETLAHRRARNRDGKTDSPFTMRVLEIEQQLLHKQAHKAKIIVSKAGELLTFEEYSRRMSEV